MSKKEFIILIGGGGHCKACIDVIEAEGRFRIAGIVDIKEKLDIEVSGYKVLATDDELPSLIKEYKNFLIALAQIKSTEKKKKIFKQLKSLGATFPSIVSPYSLVSRHSEIGEATIVMHGVCINAGVKIGRNCVINTSAVIEHDAVIGDHCHISTGSIVNGECHIGNQTFIGSNSVINNNVKIVGNTIVGAGSVVIKPLNESGTYVGNPAGRVSY